MGNGTSKKDGTTISPKKCTRKCRIHLKQKDIILREHPENERNKINVKLTEIYWRRKN